MAAVEGSLQRMNTDYLDVYLIHAPDRKIPLDKTMQALADIVQQGKARLVGSPTSGRTRSLPVWRPHASM